MDDDATERPRSSSSSSSSVVVDALPAVRDRHDDDTSSSSDTSASSEDLIGNASRLPRRDDDDDDEEEEEEEEETVEAVPIDDDDRRSADDDDDEVVQAVEVLDDEQETTTTTTTRTKDDDGDARRSSSDVKAGPPKMRIKLSLRMGKRKDDNVEGEEESDDASPPSSSAHRDDASPSRKKQRREKKKDGYDDDGATASSSDAAVVSTTSTEPSRSRPRPAATVDSSSNDAHRGNPAPSQQPPPPSQPQQQQQQQRPVRMPPIASPGLLLHRGGGRDNGGLPHSSAAVCRPVVSSASTSAEPSSSDAATPSRAFDAAMEAAGYTDERRTSHPHRGSSVRREVGDLFDRDVTLTVGFPELVPKWMVVPSNDDKEEEEDDDDDNDDNDNDDEKETKKEKKENPKKKYDLSRLLIESVTTLLRLEEDHNTHNKNSVPSFLDMVPRSLTVPESADHVARRAAYVEKVLERERAIVASQAAAARVEDEILAHEETRERARREGRPAPKITATLSPVEVPLIPVPPENVEEEDDVGRDPSLTPHLDPSLFRTGRRYHGLSSNRIADPHFVGPNAPVAGAGGHVGPAAGALATAQSSDRPPHHHASSHHPSDARTDGGWSSGGAPSAGGATASRRRASQSKAARADARRRRRDVLVRAGVLVTGTAQDLRRTLESDPETARRMRVSLIKAALHACETSTEGGPWTACNGETYPDVSKAFAMHGGLRPCARCKSNKQGAYHCRLRRRHKGPDYDGRNSVAVLETVEAPESADITGRTVGTRRPK